MQCVRTTVSSISNEQYHSHVHPILAYNLCLLDFLTIAKRFFRIQKGDRKALQRGGKERTREKRYVYSKLTYLNKLVWVCSTLCIPMDCRLPVSSVHGILQARILEWVAIPFSWGSSYRHRDQTCVSCIAGRFFTV